MVDRIERGAEIKQYEDRYFAGIDVAHELVMNGFDCSLGRVVGSIGRLTRRQQMLGLDVFRETCSDDSVKLFADNLKLYTVIDITSSSVICPKIFTNSYPINIRSATFMNNFITRYSSKNSKKVFPRLDMS